MIGDGDIEFLDDAAKNAVGVVDEVDDVAVAVTSPLRWLAAVVALVGGVWFLTSSGAAEDQPPLTTPPDTAPIIDPPLVDEEIAQAPIDRVAVVAPTFGVWPTPREHDPSVVLTAGSSPLPEAFAAYAFESTTIVYVSAAGRPAVLAFNNGDVSEVNVAATRVHDTFAVQAGQVIPINPDDELGIIFHTYRDVDQPGVGIMGETSGAGFDLELCLSGETCSQSGLGLDRVRDAGLVAERFSPLRHPQLNDLLNGWERVDDSLVSPDGFRIPQPVGLIWVIGPTDGGSVSSSGRL